MSKQKWEVKGHNYQIADTGDYDGYWEVTNGVISLMTKDDPDEGDVLIAVADALNKSECEFYTDDSDKWLAHHYKQEMEKGDKEIETLKAENSKMRQALAKIIQISEHEDYGNKSENCPVCIATEALKTTC